jgi:hypothetical protein
MRGKSSGASKHSSVAVVEMRSKPNKSGQKLLSVGGCSLHDASLIINDCSIREYCVVSGYSVSQGMYLALFAVKDKRQ